MYIAFGLSNQIVAQQNYIHMNFTNNMEYVLKQGVFARPAGCNGIKLLDKKSCRCKVADRKVFTENLSADDTLFNCFFGNNFIVHHFVFLDQAVIFRDKIGVQHFFILKFLKYIQFCTANDATNVRDY